MPTALRLLRAYFLIFVVFTLAIAAFGHGVGPIEFLILAIFALAAGAYSTRTTLRTRPRK